MYAACRRSRQESGRERQRELRPRAARHRTRRRVPVGRRHRPMTYTAFAIAAPGLAPLVAAELRRLALPPSAVSSDGVTFRTTLAGIATANLWLRTASRVVVRAGQFHASAFHELERRARRVQWTAFLAPGVPVSIRVTCRKSR